MVKEINYNTDITGEYLGEYVKDGHILYDRKDRVLGSVSGKRICDLNGDEIATCVSKETAQDENGKKIRVANYSSETRNFRLVGDKLYTVEETGEIWLGRISHTERNTVHIVLLSVLAFFLTATVILIALIGLPVASAPPTEPPEPDTLVPVIDISDEGGDWEDGRVIGMFGDSLLPGSSGKYEFVIRNPHDVVLSYDFWIEPQYEGELDIEYFPIRFRIKMNNVYAGSGELLKVNELTLKDMRLLDASAHDFTLEWEWPFDGYNDEFDTLLGEDGGKISLVLHITAQTTTKG